MGFEPPQLAGKRLHDLLNIAGRIFYETHFAPLLRMQGFFNEVALDLITRRGERLSVLVNAGEKRDKNGAHLFTRLTVFNATDRRRYERELINAKAAAAPRIALLTAFIQCLPSLHAEKTCQWSEGCCEYSYAVPTQISVALSVRTALANNRSLESPHFLLQLQCRLTP